MKNILWSLAAILASAGLYTGCKKDENKIFTTGGNAPVIIANTSAARLVPGEESKETIRFSWTNPNYQFTTGISSHDVNYTLEFDTLGGNFKSSNKFAASIAKDLSKTYTQLEMNDILSNRMSLATGRSHQLEARIISTLANNSLPLVSNIWRFTAIPFIPPPAINPPTSGTLFITGAAVASDWTNMPPNTQRFNRVSNTLFELTVPLAGAKSYTFLSTYGSWADKYSIAIKNDPASVNGGTFQWQGEDILSPPVGGNYKISVDFQAGKFTVIKQ